MAEFPNLGKHCSLEGCKQIDFLPFTCESCQQVFCLDHKFPDNHSCSKFGAETPHAEYTGTKAYSCSFTECDSRELMPVVCEKCAKNFCLRHRHQNDHQCEKLEEKKTQNKTAEHVQQILANKKVHEIPKKPRGKKSSKTAAKVALMKMKLHAAGDTKIPEFDRVYFSVVLPGGSVSKGPNKPLFFSKTWSVGRVIDVAADRTSITNTNNTGSPQKLRLFSFDDGSLLPIDQNIDTLLTNETIFNGGTVILERVTDDVTSVNVELYK
ncbi:AN1-type zinc finger protein 1-like isoform X2 [Saccostrea echinata]|uniref:AN1-type zinc finger protein 1-like isoform X2 n=1 Tax=Saccostrea echinata TaxID=191078 RepID=UPI002A7ECAAC|nr:AN1-type zinc finger protein 1-like isoform X2 [Saccostrea echinata]